MNRFRFYLIMIGRHRQHGGLGQAGGYALKHWRFWQGAIGDNGEYIHIGSKP